MATTMALSVNKVAGSTSVVSNTSKVQIVLTVTTTNDSHNLSGDTSGYIKLDGVQIANLAGKTFGKTSTTTIYSGTHPVTHDADGRKTITVAASFNTEIAAGTLTASKTLTLDTIARASEPTLSASSVRMEDKLTITTNRKDSSFTHTLKYTLNGSTGTIATGVGASYAWTVPDLAAKIDNKTSDTCTITCETYSGGTQIGTKTVSLTMRVQPATEVTRSSATVQMGKTVTLYCNRESTNFTHKLTYEIGSMTGTIGTDITTSKEWTPAKSLAAYTGNKTSATCTITCTTYNGTAVVGTTTKEITLTVPDATVPSVSPTTVALGSTLAISLPRETTVYEHKILIDLKNHGTSTVVHSTQFAERRTTDFEWSIPYTFARHIPSATKGTMTFTCITYFAGTESEVGRETVSFTVTVPDNDTTKPTIDSMTLSAVNGLSTTFAGLYIQSKSQVRAAFTGSSNYSEIASYRVTVEGKSSTGNPAVSAVLTQSGTLTVTGRATDKRGYYRETTEDIEVIPYTSPRVIPGSGNSDIICERSKSNGVPSHTGEYLHIKCGRKFSPVTSDGVQKNYCKLEYRVKAASAADFPDKWTELLGKTAKGNYVEATIDSVVQSVVTAYTVQLRAVDDVGDMSIVTISVPAADTPLHLGEGGKNVGIGQYCDYSESERVDIGWKTYFNTGIGRQVIFEADSGGWAEGAILNTAFPDADTSKVMDYTLFLAILSSTVGGASNIHPVLCVRQSNRIYGSLTMAMLDADTTRTLMVYMRRNSSGGTLELRRCRMLYHVPNDVHGDMTTLDENGTSDQLMITAFYALL